MIIIIIIPSHRHHGPIKIFPSAQSPHGQRRGASILHAEEGLTWNSPSPLCSSAISPSLAWKSRTFRLVAYLRSATKHQSAISHRTSQTSASTQQPPLPFFVPPTFSRLAPL
eukprot:70021-Rhodomonas_salina.6